MRRQDIVDAAIHTGAVPKNTPENKIITRWVPTLRHRGGQGDLDVFAVFDSFSGYNCFFKYVPTVNMLEYDLVKKN